MIPRDIRSKIYGLVRIGFTLHYIYHWKYCARLNSLSNKLTLSVEDEKRRHRRSILWPFSAKGRGGYQGRGRGRGNDRGSRRTWRERRGDTKSDRQNTSRTSGTWISSTEKTGEWESHDCRTWQNEDDEKRKPKRRLTGVPSAFRSSFRALYLIHPLTNSFPSLIMLMIS